MAELEPTAETAKPLLLKWLTMLREQGWFGVLKRSEMAALMTLTSYADSRSLEAYPTLKTIVAAVNESNPQRVRDSLKLLMLHGLIEPLGKIPHPPYPPTDTYRLAFPEQAPQKIRWADLPRKSREKETESVSFAASRRPGQKTETVSKSETENVFRNGTESVPEKETDSVSFPLYKDLTPQSLTPHISTPEVLTLPPAARNGGIAVATRRNHDHCEKYLTCGSSPHDFTLPPGMPGMFEIWRPNDRVPLLIDRVPWTQDISKRLAVFMRCDVAAGQFVTADGKFSLGSKLILRHWGTEEFADQVMRIKIFAEQTPPIFGIGSKHMYAFRGRLPEAS